MTKVLMVETLPDGGIAHYAYNLSNALENTGVRVALFTCMNFEFNDQQCAFRIYRTMFRLAGWLVKIFPSFDGEKGFICYLRRVVKLMEYPFNTVQALVTALKHRIDVVHFQSVNEIELFMVLAIKLIGKPVVFTVHNIMPRHGNLKFYQKLIFQAIYGLCDRIIIHTESGKHELGDIFKTDINKVTVIPHGDYKFFSPESPCSIEEARDLLRIGRTTKCILFFGAIRANKGLDNLLAALPDIKEKVPEVKLMIVGELCEDYGKYRKIIEKEKLRSSIFEKLEYVPNDEIEKYFVAADLIVLPYTEVSGSGVLQIAYAFGKPLVASDLAGFREVIEEGKNGYLVPLGDKKMLAEKISDILIDEEKCQIMGQYSRHLADTKYSWESIASSTKQVYAKKDIRK